MSPRASVDACPWRKLNPNPSAVQPVAVMTDQPGTIYFISLLLECYNFFISTIVFPLG
jgi:hypothetical protein